MTADVVVVGGGVLGQACALRLVDDGRTVAWIHPGHRDGMASAAAGAMYGVFSEASSAEPEDERHAAVALRLAARRRSRAWLDDLGDRSGIDITTTDGTFVVGTNIGESDDLELAAIAGAAAHAGCAAESVSWREVPGLRPDGGVTPVGALYLPDEGSVDTATLLDGLGAVLRAHPCVRAVVGRALRLRSSGVGFAVDLEDGSSVAGAQVVLAAGTACADLLDGVLTDPDAGPVLFAGRGVSAVVSTVSPPPVSLRTPNRAFACGLHLVPRADGRTYVGATNRLSTAPDLDGSPTVGELTSLLRGATMELDTELGRASLESVAVGARPIALDRRPLVGPTTTPGVHLATATYRNGILLAPLVADLVARGVAEPGALAAHPWAADRPVVPAGVDRAALARGAAGLLASFVEGGRLDPGRRGELTAFVQEALALFVDPDAESTAVTRAVRRLAGRAPFEEVVPSLFTLVTRGR